MANKNGTVTLKEIFEYEKRVYIDYSAQVLFSRKDSDKNPEGWLKQGVERIKQDINAIKGLIKILEKEQSYTVAETTKEIEQYKDAVVDRLFHPSYDIRRSKDVTNALRELKESVSKTVRSSRRKEIDALDTQFQTMYNLVALIAQDNICNTKTKENKHLKIGDAKTRVPADEKYVAACLVDTLRGVQPSLLTADARYFSLLGNIPRIAGSDLFAPYNDAFKRCYQSQRPQLFFVEKEGTISIINLDTDTQFERFPLKFNNAPLVDKIKSFWQQH